MDLFYKDALEHCQTFNSRLMTERQVRLPYLDSQTGVAQNKCNLWLEKRQRGPGLKPNQIYSYPSKRWRKNPSQALPDPVLGVFETTKLTKESILNVGLAAATGDAVGLLNENSNDSHSLDFEGNSCSPATIREQEYQDDDEDYYDDDRPKKRLRRGRGRGGRPPKIRPVEMGEGRYNCNFCGRKYKNKSGLNQHIQQAHPDEIDLEEESSHTPLNTDDNAMSRSSSIAGEDVAVEKKKKKGKNDYCDFCLGGSDENKKTGEAEELVSCSDCTRSGHPTCLQFTKTMTRNVKQYHWQCIECKSCHICGTSDNDDQLLFCDDCDRGYHMYCLHPPMEEPPEGSWICKLCEDDRKMRIAKGLPID